MPHSKRFINLKKLIDSKKAYPLEEALELVKKTATTKFDSGVEVHIRLGIDPKKGDQQVRGSVILPHGTGKTKKIAAFVSDNQQAEAKEAGADIIGNEEYIATIKKSGKCDFDIAIATPEMMKKLAPIAKILGPKGLMPSPKDGTVTPDIKKVIAELKKGKTIFKNDDSANLHILIGKISFSREKLKENFETLLGIIKRAKPAGAKGIYIKNISLTSSMGPGIKVAV